MGTLKQALIATLRVLMRVVKLLMMPLRPLLPERGAVVIRPFRGYASGSVIAFKGRVMENIDPENPKRSVWSRLNTLYRRLASRGIAEARVEVVAGEQVHEVVCDESGFFDVRLDEAGPGEPRWHRIGLRLLAPATEEPVTAAVEVYRAPKTARYLVISDIDDTVVHTGVSNKLNMLWRLYTSPAESRTALPGVAPLYRALHEGAGGEDNPMFYVSRGPWFLYPLLTDVFRTHEIPVGPVLYLRDWGITFHDPLPKAGKRHKEDLIDRLLEDHPDLPVILIGDSGQRDPEIYTDVVERYGDRVLAVYIRDVTLDESRRAAIMLLAQAVGRAGSELILSEDAHTLAAHAARRGWVNDDAPGVVAEAQRAEAA